MILSHRLRSAAGAGSSFSGITTNLTTHWDFGNSSSYSSGGTSITDLSGNNNGGTINDPNSNISYSSDNGGHIILTNDSTNSATISRDSDLFHNIGTGDFTLEFWWNPYYENSRASSGLMNLFINMPMTSQNYKQNVRIQIRSRKIKISGWFIAPTTTASGSFTDLDSSNVYLQDGAYHGWEHLVFSRIGNSSNNMKFYRNNSLASTWTNKADYDQAMTNTGIKVVVTSDVPAGSNYNYRGKFAIFRFYIGTGLTSSQVTTNWNIDKTRFGH